ncbi:hypothetical protein GCM10022384_53920 [Streptomyces marokkonensis]|uniref:Uncharacterized protein n=1 Tax=Streptomyces marokkonensis TaxID=324855 RepID=A0ABP7RNQ7_9ACTN
MEDAEAEVEKRATAEGEAEGQAEQAVAAARNEAQAWVAALAKAKEQMGGFEKAAKEEKEKVGPANEKQTDAAAAVKKWAKPVNDAQEAVAAAEVLVEDKEGKRETAAKARVAAEAALENLEKDKETAQGQLSEAVTEQKTYEAAQAGAQEEVRKAHADASVHRRAETEARTEAAAAAREQLRARKAEAAAREAAAEVRKRMAKAAEQTPQAAEPGFLEKARTKTKSALSLTNAKKRLDPSDTAVLRGSAPSGVAAQAHAKDSNTEVKFGGPPQLQFESGSNAAVSVLGAVNDGRGYLSARKVKDAKGAEAHQADKDKKGKSAGFLTNSLMTISDGLKVGNAAMKNKGVAEGVTGLGEGTGVLTAVFSVGIGARESRVLHRTKHKRRNLVKHSLKDVEAVRGRALQKVLDRLGDVNAELAATTAGLSGPQAGPTEEQLKSLGESQAEADNLRKELMEHLASGQQYAIKKQDRKIVKRAVNLGGNVIRTAGGILAVVALAGTLATPAAPAVGAGAAAALGGLAAYKGGKGGYKRAMEVRHPAKWARTTLAQGETEFTEKTEETEEKGSKRKATAEAFKVTKSVGQGERQLTAQEIYALAAGPAVPVGKNVPKEARDKARELLIDLNCTPEKRKESKEEWEDSLNDPDRQEDWEKYIAKQLAS